jgi:anti-sigma factor RsiW
VNYDDETLMAFADGELDPVLGGEIAAAIEQDPLLARRVERHRALRAEVADAYATVLEQPVPERLVAAAKGSATAGAVLQFPARAGRVPTLRWGGREWAAMAASLFIGGLIGWKVLVPAEPRLMTVSGGTLVARGPLARALDRQLASTQRVDDAVQIGLTFRAQDGHYCRSFVVREAGTAGLACRSEGQWRIPVTAAVAAGEGLRQAASPPPAVLSAIEARISGEALDAGAEENARLGGWDPARE